MPQHQIDQKKLDALRQLITESIRIQRDTPRKIPYIDTRSSLPAASARQNHVIYGRRGCGKSLLLHRSADQLGDKACCIYLNCEDFKRHSFPNVLIEILEPVFKTLGTHRVAFCGKKKKIKYLLKSIRKQLSNLKEQADAQDELVRQSKRSETERGKNARVQASAAGGGLSAVAGSSVGGRDFSAVSEEIEFRRASSKLDELNKVLPEIKDKLREFFSLSSKVEYVILQIDDYYHLRLADQPFVIDYVHRLCKDLPIYFKVATLRHVSALYVERDGQPIGVQQRHDYLPVDIDYTFEDFSRTEREIKTIFHEYGKLAEIQPRELDRIFKGEGFRRLVVVAGGVPRDCLSLFLQALDRAGDNDGRIGKDTMRLLSREVFEARIQELKDDSKESEQDELLRGVYTIRDFCLKNKINAFETSELPPHRGFSS